MMHSPDNSCRAFLRRWQTASWCVVVAMFLLTLGCGGPEMAQVSGKVTVAGEPVTRGSVAFMPDKTQQADGKIAAGDIGPDGTYTLKTLHEGDGAYVGRYSVSISGRASSDEEHVPPNRQVPAKFGLADRSGLTAEVKSGTNEINFDLKP